MFARYRPPRNHRGSGNHTPLLGHDTMRRTSKGSLANRITRVRKQALNFADTKILADQLLSPDLRLRTRTPTFHSVMQTCLGLTSGNKREKWTKKGIPHESASSAFNPSPIQSLEPSQWRACFYFCMLQNLDLHMPTCNHNVGDRLDRTFRGWRARGDDGIVTTMLVTNLGSVGVAGAYQMLEFSALTKANRFDERFPFNSLNAALPNPSLFSFTRFKAALARE